MLVSGLIVPIVGSPGGSESTVCLYSACPSLMISRFFANDSHLDLPQAAPSDHPQVTPQAYLRPTSGHPQLSNASALSVVSGAFFSNACRYSFNQCVFVGKDYQSSKGIPYEGFGAINGINDLRQLARIFHAIRVRATGFCSSHFLT